VIEKANAGEPWIIIIFFPIQLRETKKSEEQTKNTNYKGGSLSFLIFFFFGRKRELSEILSNTE
jgi:hypothetical protein